VGKTPLNFIHRPTFVLLAISTLLSGCVTTSDHSEKAAAAQPSFTDQIREVDLSPRFPRGIGHAAGRGSEKEPGAQVYYGSSVPPAKKDSSGTPVSTQQDAKLTTGSVSADAEKGYEINFENTPVPTVAKTVLGDILHIPYVIDPRVKATVSLSSGRAVPRKDLLYVVDNALRVSNVALVREGAGYRLVPSADAVGTGALDRGSKPDAGYGISVIPLQFVSASVLTKLIENFAAKPGMVRADQGRNLLLIQGTASDRRSAINTALNFDVDWMRGQSVGIYPIKNSTPEPIISELNHIVDADEGGLNQNVVKLQAIERENAILVVTRSRSLLKQVSTWISRLDRSGGAGTGVKVYRMRFGDARQVAKLLNDIFLGSSNDLDSDTNQLAPGGGQVTSSSDQTSTGQSSSHTGTQTHVASAGSQNSAQPASFNSRFGGGGVSFSGSLTNPFGSQSSKGGSNSPATSGSAKPILANVRIAPDVANNALLIYANQENYSIIKRALQEIDRPQLQVAIDATIAEVSLNDKLRYGVQFYLANNGASVMNTALNTVANAALSRVVPGFNFLIGSEENPHLILDALREVTQVKVLSRPSLVVLDNQYASLQVGDEIPITVRTAQSVDTSSTAPVVNNIEYRNTGVILKVAPRINANGHVLLKVEQEISQVADTSSAETLTPTVTERRVKSSISVADGQTVLLGGLISDYRTRTRDNVPGIEQVPVVNELFAHRDGRMKRTELIIFIRPQIIRNGVDAYHVAEELRSKMQGFGGHRPQYRPLPIHK